MSLEKLERYDASRSSPGGQVALAEPAAADLERLVARLLVPWGGAPLAGWSVQLTRPDLQRLLGESWMMGARVALNTAQGRRICRICGCWELEACEGGCAWVAEDLCDACSGKG